MTELATAGGRRADVEAPEVRDAGSTRFAFVHFVLPPLAVAAAVVGVWLFVTYQLLRRDQRSFLPPPHEVVSRGLPRVGSPAADPRGPRPNHGGRRDRPRHRVRHRHARRDSDEPGDVARANRLPIRRDPSDDPARRDRADHRSQDGLLEQQPDRHLRDDLHVPDHRQHSVRAEVARPHRSTTSSRCTERVG